MSRRTPTSRPRRSPSSASQVVSRWRPHAGWGRAVGGSCSSADEPHRAPINWQRSLAPTSCSISRPRSPARVSSCRPPPAAIAWILPASGRAALSLTSPCRPTFRARSRGATMCFCFPGDWRGCPTRCPAGPCLGFYQGVVPCCLGETMVLALENRAESFSSAGPRLADIQEIGDLAETWLRLRGVVVLRSALGDSALARFQKAAMRHRSARLLRRRSGTAMGMESANPCLHPRRRSSARHAGRAASSALHQSRPYGVGHKSGFVKTFVRAPVTNSGTTAAGPMSISWPGSAR